jgi:hypothetical protein
MGYLGSCRPARYSGWRRGSAVALVGLTAFFATAAGASAKIVHRFEGSFNKGPEEKPIPVMLSVAVDNASGSENGDVYVGAQSSLFGGEGEVYKFTPTGTFLSKFNGSKTPGGSFALYEAPFFNLAQPIGSIAVDGSASHPSSVYVADRRHDVVDRFSPSGTFECEITGKKPTAEESKVVCDGEAGATPSEGLDPAGLAVSGAGELYVVDTAHDMIDRFGPKGEFLGGISEPTHLPHPMNVAVDSAGDLFVSNGALFSSEGSVVELSASGKYIATLSLNHPTAVAVDRAHERVYSSSEEKGVNIYEFGPLDELLSTFGSEQLKVNRLSIATNETTGQVYVAEFNIIAALFFKRPESNVYIYSGDLLTPNALTAEPTEVEKESATLRGEVKLEGGPKATGCEFEYGETTAYGQTATCEPPLPSEATTAVSAKVTGLKERTVYHFRIKVENKNGVGYSEDREFTSGGAPGMEVESALAGPHTATFRTRINPFAAETSCVVEYVTAAQFAAEGYANAQTVPCLPDPIRVGFSYRNVIARAAGLLLDTTYHFRFVARNRFGVTEGPDEELGTFGLELFNLGVVGEGQVPFSEAGGHPFELQTLIKFNSAPTNFPDGKAPSGNLKDVTVDLPPGLIGNPLAVPRCTLYKVEQVLSEEERCPADSEVGVIEVGGGTEIDETEGYGFGGSLGFGFTGALYNIVPRKGAAAEFAADIYGFAGAIADIQVHVRTGEGYGVAAATVNVPAIEALKVIRVRLWGVPAASAHDGERLCVGEPGNGEIRKGHLCKSSAPLEPFLRAPTSCSAAVPAYVQVDAYQAPGEFVQAEDTITGMRGCENLRFTPAISLTPESSSSDSPTGVQFTLTVPQPESPNIPSEADLKNAVVTLPAGVTVNPAAASGLVGCPLLTGHQPHPGAVGIDLENGEPANCPQASRIGSVRIKSQLLEEELVGGVYVAQQGNAGSLQESNPFGSLLALYIVAEAPQRGVVIKLAGKVTLNPITGQLTVTFNNNPQLPFEVLKLNFFGGPRAALATPRSCGTYTTTSLFEPWSHQPAPGEAAGTPDATPESSFAISSGPGGSACPSGAGPFAPAFEAGTSTNQAGGFSPFVTKVSRSDGEQRLSTVAVKLPPGVAGLLASVPLCPEPEANQGNCPLASQIGHVVVQAGVGQAPVTVPQAGKPQDPVYLTGPYKGAPFGLTIVVPAEAGPFNLDEGGRPIVVRAKLEVDPRTGQVSVLSEPIPTILQGVPLDVRTVYVDIDRAGFIFNPTSCEPTAVTGSIGSVEGASAAVSSRFQAAGCAALPFHPTFQASTVAQTSRLDGAQLEVQIGSHGGPTQKEEEANIHKVEVQLPLELPSRLSTLNKACLQETFLKNPYSCPPQAFVGIAEAHTPILRSPLKGPAIFVARGAQFPNLEILLEGEGIKIDLEGHTQIHNGITYSRFETVPDEPISSFQLLLPRGPHSALSANGSLCYKRVVRRLRVHRAGRLVVRKLVRFLRRRLVMPTTITGQNGAVIHQRTVITVAGCKPKTARLGALRRGVKRR